MCATLPTSTIRSFIVPKRTARIFTPLTDRFIQAMHEDLGGAGHPPPTQEPRATEAMTDMIAAIQTPAGQGFRLCRRHR